MSSISLLTNEYLYEFKLFFRKTLPKNEAFYIVLFFTKFFPIILFTHSIDPNSHNYPKLFTLSKIIRALVIFNHAPQFSYITLCIILYVLLLTFMISIAFVFIRYYLASRKTDYVLYSIPCNSLNLSKRLKLFFKISIYFYIIIIFFYQHIVEILYYGIFSIYYGTPSDIDQANKLLDYNGQYVFLILNIIFICLLMFSFYIFILFAANQSITSTYGFQMDMSHQDITFHIVLFSLQGLYSTSFYYDDDIRKKYDVLVAYILFFILLLSMLNSFKHINFHYSSKVCFSIRFMNNFCLVSCLIEILIYHFAPERQKGDQKYYFGKLILDVINGFILTLYTAHIQKRLSFKRFSNGFFVMNKIFEVKSLFEFFLFIHELKTPQEKYLLILKMIQVHQEKCNLETCQCHKYQKYFLLMNDKNNIEKVVNKFISLGEKKITERITNHLNSQSDSLDKLLYLHCAFLFSIKKSIPITLYMCQYYLMKKKNELNFPFSYKLYELNALTIEKLKQRQKHSIKVANFVQESIIYEKVRKIIVILCSHFEKLMYFKTLKNTNSKLLFECEDVLYPLIDYISMQSKLKEIIRKYVKLHFFEHSLEIRYIIYYYTKLFNIDFEKKTINKIYKGQKVYPSLTQIIDEKIELKNIRQNYMILFLNSDNRFLIRYISTETTEELGFIKNELINKDFNELLIPKQITHYHSIYMKTFILMGYPNYQKKSFLVNKELQLLPYNINCKIIPMIDSLYSIIVNIEKQTTVNSKNYHVILDMSYHVLCISEAFELQFFFSLKMLNMLKINFCDFFGVNKEKINELYKQLKGTKSTTRSNYLPFASTSIKGDEQYYYKTMDINFFKNYSDKEKNNKENNQWIRFETVPKDKIVNSVIKLGKNIEELGMEKEWKWKLQDLYNKLKNKVGSTDEMKTQGSFFNGQSYNMSVTGRETSYNTPSTNNPMNNFYITFHLKQIGVVQYYITTISEYIDDNLSAKNKLEDRSSNRHSIVFLRNETSEYLTLQYAKEEAILQKKRASFLLGASFDSGFIPEDGGSFNFNNADLNVSINQDNSFKANLQKDNSKMSLFNNDFPSAVSAVSGISAVSAVGLNTPNQQDKNMFSLKQRISMMKGSSNSNRNAIANSSVLSSDDDLNILSLKEVKKRVKMLNFLKIGEGLFFVIVLILNLTNFIQNSATIDYSLNLFYINAYSFLLTNDLFYGSLACIRACFISDGIQDGSMDSLNLRISQSAEDLINHYQLLNTHTNKLINKKQTNRIYDIFTVENDYYYLISNWGEKVLKSNMIDEIYAIHYWLKTFNAVSSSNTNNCRIEQFFFNMQYKNITLDLSSKATSEEKFIYYICNNIITDISDDLESLSKITNEILNKDNRSAKNSSVAFNSSILVCAAILYVIIILSIQISRTIFKARMAILFTKHDYEEIFFDDVKKFKKLIEEFSMKDCNEYTVFKNGLLNGNTVTPKSFISVSPNEKKSRQRRHSPNRREKFSKKESIYSKVEIAKDTAEALALKIENTNKQFSKKSEPKYAFCSIIILCITFLAFFGVEIANILVCSQSNEGLLIENEFATNFFSRGPKMNELVLYSIISVVMGDVQYITKETSTYPTSILSNYYDKDLDLSTNSIFSALDTSNYAYLYYQLYIIRSNIDIFVNAKDMYQYLLITTKNEFYFYDGENFCIYASYQYIRNYYESVTDPQTFLEKFSSLVSDCRKLGNGINLSGYKTGIDLMLQILNTLYYNFKLSTSENKIKNFLQDPDLVTIIDNLLIMIRTLHFADSFLVIDDIENSYKKSHNIKVIFSIISICFSCGIILGMLIVIILRLDEYNRVLEKIVLIFEKIVSNYK